MKTSQKTVFNTVSLIFTVLLSWAVAGKAFDFKNFCSQLEHALGCEGSGQAAALIIIALQLLNIVLLCFGRTRLLGLWLTLGMMTVFTGYTAALIMYSTNLPCTCIGFIGNMNWNGNLILNITLMITAMAGLLTARNIGDKA